MSYSVQFANTQAELAAILELRYTVLRAPWQQPAATATDNLEAHSFNAYICDEKGQVIACGRLQQNEGAIGQIRFMAVAEHLQGKGLGKLLMTALEEKAKHIGLKTIELQARENAVAFYKYCGYENVEPTFKLWDIIQHYLMRKHLPSV